MLIFLGDGRVLKMSPKMNRALLKFRVYFKRRYQISPVSVKKIVSLLKSFISSGLHGQDLRPLQGAHAGTAGLPAGTAVVLHRGAWHWNAATVYVSHKRQRTITVPTSSRRAQDVHAIP